MITGKDIHDIYTSITWGAHPWEALELLAQWNYGEMAAQLNEGHITPLQGEIDVLKALVHDYYEFNKGDAPRLRAPYRVWDADRNVLQAYAAKLLKEEEK